MAESIDIGTLITRTPGIKNGVPHIAGTGVTVRRIATWYKLGNNAEEIAAQIPHLSLAGIYAALTYYHANNEEIEADLAFQEAEADRLEAEHRKTVEMRGILRLGAAVSAEGMENRLEFLSNWI